MHVRQKSTEISDKTFRKVFVAALFCGAVLAAPVLVWAEDVDVVNIHVAYLDESTDWCPADTGVPGVITVDGPDVFVGEFNNAEPARVRVRRGADSVEKIEVGRLGVSQVRIGGGGNTRTFERLYPRVDELIPLGRLRADIKFCQAIEPYAAENGTWRVEAADGTVVRSGKVKIRFLSLAKHPLFRSSRRYPRAIKLGDQTFVVMNKPEFVRTTQAFVSLAEEQAQ